MSLPTVRSMESYARRISRDTACSEVWCIFASSAASTSSMVGSTVECPSTNPCCVSSSIWNSFIVLIRRLRSMPHTALRSTSRSWRGRRSFTLLLPGTFDLGQRIVKPHDRSGMPSLNATE